MPRPNRHYYAHPGSFERIEEAALDYADADTDDDEAYYRARARLRAAVVQFHLEAKPERGERRATEQEPLPLRGGHAPRSITLKSGT